MNRMAMRIQLLAALAALPLLGGCVAVVALPILAGGAMFGGADAKVRVATPRPQASGKVRLAAIPEELTAGQAVVTATAIPTALSQGQGSGTAVVVAGLTELPPPEPAAPGPWRRFIDYATDKSAELAGKGTGRSVLLETDTSLALPRMRTCEGKIPAVVVDLDPGAGRFAAGQPHVPPPGLTDGLARLRDAGVVVLWVTGSPAGDVGLIAEALKTSGLDPEGKDPLLLARSGTDRKQVLRQEANRDVCVIAIAGDRKGDFDELFDYLRDPRGGESLDYLLGAGWFIVPLPLG